MRAHTHTHIQNTGIMKKVYSLASDRTGTTRFLPANGLTTHPINIFCGLLFSLNNLPLEGESQRRREKINVSREKHVGHLF